MRTRMKSSILLGIFIAISVCAAKNSVCYKCNSSEDGACHLGVTHNETLLETCEDDTGCYTELVKDATEYVFHTHRGCLSAKTGKCYPLICSKCTDDKCNSGIFPEDRQTCNTCDSVEDCAKEMVAQPCKKFSPDITDCATLFTGNAYDTVMKRACVTDLTVRQNTTCAAEKTFKCTKCNTKDCNTQSESKGYACYECGGFYCYDAPTADTLKTRCWEGCYNGVDSLGYSSRDCVEARWWYKCGTEDDGKSTCIKCFENYCNKQIFPKNRLKCNFCSGKGCKSDETTKDVCHINHDNLSCVTIFDGPDVILRTCSSQLSKENSDICNSGEDCLKCTTDYCNTESTKPLKCKVCNSETDPNCIYNLTAVGDEECDELGCYNSLLDDGNIKRGCAKDLKENECKEANCEICKNSKCNAGVLPYNRHSCTSVRR